MNYVVIDLEMCKVPKERKTTEFRWARELIQIGAVMLNDEFDIVDKFTTYVCPEFGFIDNSIKTLTGIRKFDVMNAPKSKEALEMFMEWLPADSIIVAWSDNDEMQLRRELEGKKIVMPKLSEMLDEVIDCQLTFSEIMDSDRRYNLKEALQLSDIDYTEQEHDALADAYNTALLFAKMKKEPVFKLSKYYSDMKEAKTIPNTPFATLLSGFDFAIA